MRILIIGTGSIGRRHIDVVQSAGGHEIVICEVDKQNADEAGVKYGISEVYYDYKAALEAGVDQFIIITDEVKHGEKSELQESTLVRIKKAFKIIMASAATVTAAMLPLMTLGLGLLKGFAITTIIGLIVGVLIVRPAFAKALEKFNE